MEYRKLGNTDIEVSVICLGTMTWGEQNTYDEGYEQMDYAVDHGVNEIHLTYIPSTKNSLVYDSLQVLGFKKTRLKNHFSIGVRKFKKDVDLLPHHISVVRRKQTR